MKSGSMSPEQLKRYGRHIILPEVGMEGQIRLNQASVLIIGAGGLGSPAALYLAAAGVGTIGLVDFDTVDLTNLQRQILHTTDSIGTSKLSSAKQRIQALNPTVSVRTHAVRLTHENAMDILRAYDVIIDGTDNFPTRYLVNDACVFLSKPNIYGSIFRFEGQASVFHAGEGPCYRCLYPEPPPPGMVPSCAEGGVFGVLPGIIGTIQATEAIKVLLGLGRTLIGRLLLVDALTMEFRTMKLKKDPQCPVCGPKATIKELVDYEAWCAAVSGAIPEENVSDVISVQELSEKLRSKDTPQLVDVREDFEREIATIGGIAIPLRELSGRMQELDAAREVVVYCHTGQRSGRAVAFLRDQGFSRARNLLGGIEAWSLLIDQTVPRY
ncbi:MAG: molybdopterin-synthase adenylyltransferase MoeB [Bacteroidota bacterium]